MKNKEPDLTNPAVLLGALIERTKMALDEYLAGHPVDNLHVVKHFDDMIWSCQVARSRAIGQLAKTHERRSPMGTV